MARTKKYPGINLRRIQVDFTPERVAQLECMMKSTRSSSYRETLESLLKLGMYIHEVIESGNNTLDVNAVKRLCFT